MILQWTENMQPNENCRYNHRIAETPFGRFLITWKGWKENDNPTVDETPWGDWYGAFASVDEAKVVCQQAMNERLQLCISSFPTDPPAEKIMSLKDTRSLIADDSFAISFQSLGQYRTHLLKFIDDMIAKHPEMNNCDSTKNSLSD